jgi:hypothetical protein
MLTDFSAYGDLLQNLGLIGVLTIALLGRYRGWWVDGPTHRKTEERCGVLQAENTTLWKEKVEDAKEQGELAKAYMKLREQERA